MIEFERTRQCRQEKKSEIKLAETRNEQKGLGKCQNSVMLMQNGMGP